MVEEVLRWGGGAAGVQKEGDEMEGFGEGGREGGDDDDDDDDEN